MTRPPYQVRFAALEIAYYDIVRASTCMRCVTRYAPRRLRMDCDHVLRTKIRVSRALNANSRKGSSEVAAILVGVINGAPAILLTKAYPAENSYGLTAGARQLAFDDCDCYIKAAARILETDADIPRSVAEVRTVYSCPPALRCQLCSLTSSSLNFVLIPHIFQITSIRLASHSLPFGRCAVRTLQERPF
jgi:hypothetical protein